MSSGQGRHTSLKLEADRRADRLAAHLADHLEDELMGLADMPDDDAPELVFDLDTPEPVASGYRGPLGQTHSRAVRVRSGDALLSVEVYAGVNADTDPDLGRRARGELAAPLHALMLAGEPLELAIPFLYHEPSLPLFAVVLPPALRHRELDERIELYRQLQLEPAGVPIPEYVLSARVVVGPAGLSALRDRVIAALDLPRTTAEQPARAASPGGDLDGSDGDELERALAAAAAKLEVQAYPLARLETPDETRAAPPQFEPPEPRRPAQAPTAASLSSGSSLSSGPAQAPAPRRSFGPANPAALHTILGVQPGPVPAPASAPSTGSSSGPSPTSLSGPLSGPSLTAIPAAIPTGISEGAEATAATFSLIVPSDTHPGDGSVDRPLDAEDAAFEEPAGRAAHAPPPAGAPLHSGGTSAGTINRPIDVTSDAFALRAAEPIAWHRGADSGGFCEPSGPVTAANAALNESIGESIGDPLHDSFDEALDSLLDAPTERPVGFLRRPPSEHASAEDPAFEPAFEAVAHFPLDPPIIPPGPSSTTIPPPSPYRRAEPGPASNPPSGHSLALGHSPEQPVPDVTATPDTIDEDLSAGLVRAVRELPPESDPLTTEVRDQPVYEPDEWLAQVMAAGACDLTVEHGRVRVALSATAIGDADVLRGSLDVRIVLHRAAAYPVVVLLVGSPAGLRGDRRDQIAAMCLDVSAERDRAVLTQLARSFELLLEVFAGARWARRVLLTAPLADNAAYVLRAADDYLAQLTALGGELSSNQACEQVAHPGYDVTGARHPDAEHFRDQQLIAVRTAAHLRAALAMAQRFARPEGEDYLVCVRGFPLVRWRRLRRHVLEQAVTWGIWMGAELARVAVSEGLARSRRDLVHRLHDGFAVLREHPTACDLDAATLEENTRALAEEARALGVTPGKARSQFDSQMESVIAGTIDQVPSGPIVPVAEQTLGELIRALDDPEERLAAALEICRRQAPAGAAPLVAAVSRMNRVDAVQVLAACVRLGGAVEVPLIRALTSSKAYVRHGAALALGLLRGDDGTAAIVELLFSEPTEIWREVARAVGQAGPPALHHLARMVREQGADFLLEERIAWALAHLGARDCHKAIAQMAGGHGALAPLAAKALVLVESASRDQKVLVSDADLPETTMNRTFSRQFFTALDDGARKSMARAPSHHGSQVIALDEGRRGERRALSDHDLPD